MCQMIQILVMVRLCAMMMDSCEIISNLYVFAIELYQLKCDICKGCVIGYHLTLTENYHFISERRCVNRMFLNMVPQCYKTFDELPGWTVKQILNFYQFTTVCIPLIDWMIR